jgi:DNA-binding transcriptional regulator GbsR (MarR family)
MDRELLLQNFEMLFKARGMSPVHGRVFGVLYLNGVLSQRQLAQETGYSVPAVSVALDELKRVGLVSWGKATGKRERVYKAEHDLTAVFRKFLRAVKDQHITPFRMLLELSGDKKIGGDVKRFERYLQRVIEVE